MDRALVFFAKKIAHKYATGHNLSKDSRQEVLAAAQLGLMEAVHRYDPTKGASLQTYAYERIMGAIKDAMRARPLVRPPRSIEEKGVQLELFADRHAPSHNPWPAVDRAIDIADIFWRLPHRERVYLYHRMLGETGEQAGARVGVNHKREASRGERRIVAALQRFTGGAP